MLLTDKKSNKHRAIKTKRPKFSSHRGRTWDYEIKVINGIEIEFWLDTTWGFYFYFQWEDQWYKVLMLNFTDPLKYKEVLTIGK